MPAPTLNPQDWRPTPPPPTSGGGQIYLAAIKAFVAAERLNTGLDTHSGQNAYDALKAAKARLYELAAHP